MLYQQQGADHSLDWILDWGNLFAESIGNMLELGTST